MNKNQRDSRLNVVQKPPMCQESQDRKEANKFTAADKRESEKRCTAHEFRVVEIALDVSFDKASNHKSKK